MPLSDPVEREHLHARTYEFRGFRRSDGLWDIEGHLTDRKAYRFKNDFRGEIEAGEPLHDMWIRLTIDEDFLVHDIEAATDAGPFRVCPDVVPNFKRIIGVRMSTGWRQKVRERVGGVEGCTHLVEMLGAMATVAYQTLYAARKRKEEQSQNTRKPALIDSCHAFRSDGEVVKKAWPEFYTGE